jgi:hypothetical protein
MLLLPNSIYSIQIGIPLNSTKNPDYFLISSTCDEISISTRLQGVEMILPEKIHSFLQHEMAHKPNSASFKRPQPEAQPTPPKPPSVACSRTRMPAHVREHRPAWRWPHEPGRPSPLAAIKRLRNRVDHLE